MNWWQRLTRREAMRPVAEELEPRVLYSADLNPLWHGDAAGPGAEIRLADEAPAALPGVADHQRRQEIVFVDAGVADAEALLAPLQAQAEAGTLEIVHLRAGEDGLAQISAALAGRSGIDALHIIAHGASAQLQLGSTLLDGATLAAHAAEIAGWGRALGDDADLLVYGCDVAAGEAGRDWVNRLALLSGADVAASTDLTGDARRGGNWALEYSAGRIEASLANGLQTQQGWGHVLAIGVDATSTGTSITSSLTVAHTTAGSNRLMLVGVSLNKGVGTAVSSINYNGAALTWAGTQSDGDAVVEIWRLVDPSLGTHSVNITFNGVQDGATAGVMTFTGVDQTTPLGAFAGNSAASGSSASVNVTSATGELVFGVVGVDDDTDRSLVPNGAQANDWVVRPSKGINGGGSTKAGAAAPVNLSWTWTGSDNWAAGGVSIKAAANTAPTLDAARSPALQAINEDAGAPVGAVGSLVSSLVDFASPSGQVDNVTDPDAGAELGIAVTAAQTGNGSWWYSTNNGSNWNALGAVADNNARLLAADASTRIYFQPNANYNGTEATAITFRAWDRSGGNANGALVSTTSNGGSTPFSTATDTASLTINAVNDAPLLSGANNLGTINRNPASNAGTLVMDLIAGQVNDVDADALHGIAVTGVVNSNGAWQFSTNGGSSWNSFGAPTSGTARLLAADAATYVRFVPNTDWSGTVSNGLSFRAWDQTGGGSAGGTADTSGNGGTSGYSAAIASASIVVTASNTAPVLSGANNLAAINEDPVANAGTLVSALIAGHVSDADPGAPSGIAVTAVDNSNGSWQYTLDGGGLWTAFGSPSDSAARLLAADANTAVRFVPNGDWNGTVNNGITFRAWDRSGAATAGSTANTSGSSGNFLDTFSADSYSNNNGSLNWATDWFENDTGGAGPTIGAFKVNGGELVINQTSGGGGYIDREANLNGRTSATFSFALTGSSLVGGNSISVQVSANGGTSYTTLATITSATSNGTKSYDISAYISANTRVRFLDPAGGNKGIKVDNVQIAVNGSNGGTTAYSTATASASITVNPVNDAPVRTAGTPAAINVNEDSANVGAVSLGLGSLSYGNGGGADEAGQTLSYRVTVIPAHITVWRADGTTPVLANDSVTLTQLRGLTYKTVADANGSSNLSWTVQDNGGNANGGADTLTENLSITVNAVNDAPVVTTTGTTLAYTENQAALAVDGALTIGDVDNVNLTGATVTISGNYTNGQDVLGFSNQLGITGIWDAGTGVLTLSGTTIVANYETALRSVTYVNTSESPNTSTRTVSFVVNDGAANSNTGARSVSVTALNDAPVLADTALDLTVAEDAGVPSGAVGSLISAFTGGISDVDGGAVKGIALVTSNETNGVWYFSSNGGTNWTLVGTVDSANSLLLADNANTRLYFAPAANFNGSSAGALTIRAWDQTGGGIAGNKVSTAVNGGTTAFSSASDVIDVSVTAVNDAPTGSVTINNTTPSQGDTLTASNSLADADGMGAITYTWKANGAVVGSGGTYVLTQAEVGKTMTVEASYTDAQGTAETVGSGATAAVINVNDAPTGSVTIDNATPSQGDTLTASNTLADIDGMGAITYTWKANGAVVGTGGTYVLTQAEVGKTMTVEASYTDAQGTAELVASSATAAVLNVNDAPTGTVTIDNTTPSQGNTLTASNSLADADGMGAITYTWKANGAVVGSGGTYVLTQAEVGKTMTVEASYTDAQGTAELVASSATAAVLNVNDAPTGSVTINNTTPSQGDTLTASNSLADADGMGAITYTWKANGAVVGTGGTYVLTQAEVGKTMTVEASYTDAQGTAELVASSATAAVLNVNDAPTGSVTIDNTTPSQGDTLTASNSLADADGMGAITYTWKANGAVVGTGGTYVLTQAEVGKTMTVEASYTDAQGTAELVASSATAAVLNVNDAPTGSVTIDNTTPSQGDTLTASNTLADADGMGAISYTWKANGAVVGSGGTYVLTQSEVGMTMTVEASYTDAQGTAELVASSATAAVLNVNDAPTGTVTIDNGTPSQGDTLTASNTLADIDGMGAITYTWKANGAVVGSGGTYVLTQAEVGKTMTVEASYTDAQGTAETVASGATSAVINVNDAPTGSVTINNTTPSQGNTLTASNSLADADGMGAITYTWKANGAVVGSGGTYVLTQAEVGKTMTVEASYTDAQGTAELVASSATAAVLNVNDAPTGSVTIDNTTPSQGDTLTASNTLADADGMGAISYTWKANGAVVGTGGTYVLTQSEVGKTVTVEASYTDAQGTAETVASSATAAVVNVNDAPTGSVTIDNTTPSQGNTLTASNSLADADGMGAITYTWKANGAVVGSGGTYVLTQAEVGKTMTVEASYTDAQGTAELVASSATAAVLNVNDAPTGSVTIDNTTPSQGDTLTASNSLADADGMGAITYTWKANGAVVGTGGTYVLTQAEVGKTMTVEASYTDAQGTAELVASSATAAVLNVNDAPTGSVTIDNTTPSQGDTLTASNSLADADGLGPITYTWKANGAVVGSGGTYVLTQAEVGKTMTVEASYTDAQGTAELVASSATAAVLNVNDAPTGTVTIDNTTPSQGDTLTASNSLADADGMGAITYTWKANGAVVGTGGTYVLTQAEVGKTMTVEASYTDAQGTAETVGSGATAAVTNVNDAPTGSVTINNTAPSQGETLTASNNLADADGMGAITYTWKANGAVVGSGGTYVLTQAEVGKTMTVEASYTDAQGTAELVASSATAAVLNVNDAPTGSVTIDNTTPSQGDTLTASNSLADADGLGPITYTWKANGAVVGTGGTYVLTQSEVGMTMTVEASYTDAQGTAELVASSATAAVLNVNDAPTGSVTIDNTTPSQGNTLTASNSLADADGMGAITYTWKANGAVVGTGGTYVLTQAEVGKTMTVEASYTDAQGTAETVGSGATAAVTNVNDAPTGSVTINNTAPSQGDTLTASNSLADADGLGPITYTWKANGAVVGTGSTYLLTQSEVGKTMTVEASYTDAQGTAETVGSGATAAVINVNDAPTGSVTIDNATPSQGDTLTASNSLADADGMGAITYTWKANGAVVGSGGTYVLTQAEVGKTMTVEASYTDAQGTAELVASSATAAVLNVNDAPTGSVTIDNATPSQGDTLTASNSLADADGLGAITYTWKANGAVVGTGSTYLLTQAEVGKTMTVEASYTDAQGTAELVASSATAAVLNVNDAPTGTVTIDNTTPSQGNTLTASNSLADADGMGAISYTWKANGAVVGSGGTYVLTQAEVGKTMTVEASYTDAQGTAELVASSATAAVLNVNDAPTGSVTIDNTTPSQGDTLTASNSLADADGMGAITYTWKANGAVVGTGGTYVLTQAEVGKTMTVEASYTDAQGTAELVASSATAAVLNVNDAPTGSVTIDNTTPSQGDTLTASNSLADADGLGAITYTWKANGAVVGTGGTFVLGQAEVGKTMTVEASYTDAQGTAETVGSGATAAVINVNDAPTGSVTIDNATPSQGDTLTASNSLADADGMGAITYTWKANGAVVGSGGTYVLTQAEVGKTMTVEASYTDAQGTSELVASSATAAVANVNDAPTGSVTINNTTPSQGNTLTASNSLADADGMGAITYTWKANGAVVGSGGTYVLTQAEVGKTMTVEASYTDAQGTAELVASSATAAVLNVNDAPTGSVTIDNTTPSQGDTLTASNTLADADGLGAITYTWKANGAVVGSGGTYVLTQAEVGKTVTVEASYTDGQGTADVVASAATAAVASIDSPPLLVSPVDLGVIEEDGSLHITPAQLLAAASDAEGGALSVQNLVLALGQGTLDAGIDGGWLFRPAPDWHGEVRLSFDVSDGIRASRAEASLSVAPVNDQPLLTVPAKQTATLGQTLYVPGLSLTDADGDLVRATLSVKRGTLAVDLSGGAALEGGAQGGASIVLVGTPQQVHAALSSLSYRPAAGAVGEDLLTLVASDADGSRYVANVGIQVRSADRGVGAGASQDSPQAEPVRAPPPQAPVDVFESQQPPNAEDGASNDAQAPAREVRVAGEVADLARLDAVAPADDATAAARRITQAEMAARSAANANGNEPLLPTEAGLLELLGWTEAGEGSGRLEPPLTGTGARGLVFDAERAEPGATSTGDNEGLLLGMGRVDIAGVATVSFTAGFVWWLTRSGGMLTMMLMGIPAWRHVDLLPVLARDLDDEDQDLALAPGPDAEDTAFEHSAYEVRLDELFESRGVSEEELS